MSPKASKPTKAEFMKLMRFPVEWANWEMYPDKLFDLQWKEYEPGSERASEHYRNGALHWWLSGLLVQIEVQRSALTLDKRAGNPFRGRRLQHPPIRIGGYWIN